jgi:hypothetical protein
VRQYLSNQNIPTSARVLTKTSLYASVRSNQGKTVRCFTYWTVLDRTSSSWRQQITKIVASRTLVALGDGNEENCAAIHAAAASADVPQEEGLGTGVVLAEPSVHTDAVDGCFF